MLRIRDAIHGDITLNELEERILRSKEVQRLHWIKQLGSTFHIYPCAKHSRFEHSLGVFYLTKKILTVLEQEKGLKLDKDEMQIIRIMAIVHDIAHIPFGHTLETELKLITDHDEGKRVDYFLKEGQLGKILGELADEVIKLLKANPMDLEKPFMLEIVKDTISVQRRDSLRTDRRIVLRTDANTFPWIKIRSWLIRSLRDSVFGGKVHLLHMEKKTGILIVVEVRQQSSIEVLKRFLMWHPPLLKSTNKLRGGLDATIEAYA